MHRAPFPLDHPSFVSKNSARDVPIVGGVRPIASGEALLEKRGYPNPNPTPFFLLVAEFVLKKVQDKFKAIVTPLPRGE